MIGIRPREDTFDEPVDSQSWRTSRCFIWWWNTVSNVWYFFSNKIIFEGEINDAKMSSFSSDIQTLIKHSFPLNFLYELLMSLRSNISSIRQSVSSPNKTPRRELKIQHAVEYFWQTSRCFIWWWNTVSNAWYCFSNKMISEGEIKDTKLSSFSSDFQFTHWTSSSFVFSLWIINEFENCR